MRRATFALFAIPVLILLAVIFMTTDTVYSQNQTGSTGLPQTSSDCDACHSCDRPMPQKPCLHECPRVERMIPPHEAISAEKSPDVVIMEELAELYMPVVFAHKLHARMSVMGGGCTLCHHYTPTQVSHPPCRECHKTGVETGNLRQPGLKGAYHRQCLGCHREWSHETECAVCHVKKAGGPLAPTVKDQSDIIGVAHPIISIPESRIYQTNFQQGPVVTFHHEEHIQLFDLKCVECHKQESCSRCHDLGRRASAVKTLEHHHQPCFTCHQGDRCEYCHGMKERPKFTHAEVGWPQIEYHKDLGCRACHPKGKQIGKLSTECTACHMNWYPGNFEHDVTGVKIEECHEGLDCTDCHVGGKFDQKPSCGNCHDDGRTYPTNPIC